jgi:MFS family permease
VPFFFGSLVNKINIRISSIIGSIAVISGYFICAFINEIEILRLIRAVSGVGSGLLIATGHRVLSASENPERSYAAFMFLVSITGACFLFLAGMVAEEGGYSLLFTTFGFTFLIIFPLTLFAKTKCELRHSLWCMKEFTNNLCINDHL